MSSSGSGDGPRGGRRPAPRRPPGGQRPSRPAPRAEPEAADDDDATQAFNIADFDFDEPSYVEEDESTVSVDSAALRARASRGAAPAEDEGEATVAMQIPQELLDEGAKGAKKTILGHPGISPRTANAVRGGASAPRRNETLAMDAQNVRRAAAQAAAADDDDGEATQAMNVDAMLAAIDDAARPPAPAPARRAPAPSRAPSPAEDDDATQAMNVDAMLAQIDDEPPARSARPAPAPPARPAPASAPRRAAPPPQEEDENESTMAVDMDAMLAEIDGGGRGGGGAADEDERTQAMDISMLDDIDMAPPKKAPRRAPAPAPAPEPQLIGDDDDWASAAAAEVEDLPPATDATGLFGPIKYALAFDGRRSRLEDQIVAIDGELQAGSGGRSRTELARLKQQYEAEHAALDAGKAKTGWIMLGAIGGGLGVVLMVIGLI